MSYDAHLEAAMEADAERRAVPDECEDCHGSAPDPLDASERLCEIRDVDECSGPYTRREWWDGHERAAWMRCERPSDVCVFKCECLDVCGGPYSETGENI